METGAKRREDKERKEGENRPRLGEKGKPGQVSSKERRSYGMRTGLDIPETAALPHKGALRGPDEKGETKQVTAQAQSTGQGAGSRRAD